MGCPQVAHPVDLAKGTLDPSPAVHLDQRHRGRVRLAGLAAAHGDQGIRAHWHPDPQQAVGDGVEDRHEKRNMCSALTDGIR